MPEASIETLVLADPEAVSAAEPVAQAEVLASGEPEAVVVLEALQQGEVEPLVEGCADGVTTGE